MNSDKDRDLGQEQGFPSLWKANLYAFLAILFVAISVALWQTNYLNKVFLQEARDHAKLAAEIISLNAQNAIEAKRTSRQIITTFLRSQIRFIRYLQHIEPFTTQELEAFAKESGLAGITIVEQNVSKAVESTAGWLKKDPHTLCNQREELRLFAKEKLFVLNSPYNPEDHTCIIAGIDATNILHIQERISLHNILKEISRLSGVKFARIENKEQLCREKNGWGCPENCQGQQSARFEQTPTGPVVVVQFDFGKDVLILGMDASGLQKKQKNTWRLLLIFSAALMVTGGMVTWLLYRHQSAYIRKMREYEMQLFQERHEASLGRSAATIAHEIRNPLNAVSMGIQRLLLDKEHIKGSNRQLLMLLKEEVQRTERIISGLLSYARPSRIKRQQVKLKDILRRALLSAQSRYPDKRFNLDLKVMDDFYIMADPDLLYQLLENLLVNAIEAMVEDGILVVDVAVSGKMAQIKIANSGKLPSEEEISRIFDPYFTTKTKGTGLGLAICKKIVRAHKGTITAKLDKDLFVIEVRLPLGAGDHGDTTG